MVGGGVDRLTVGIGMVPRGEVGLIFANIGLTLSIRGRPILDQSTFAAVLGHGGGDHDGHAAGPEVEPDARRTRLPRAQST